ncbi:trypsin-like serine protease [Halopseudomonas salegens]|uniref:Trypsin n=1 Tax=Halopseudomonas salegens TaxID=1434072 RepID=A0A1H2I310_9GAMM|nr:trypsin-like serine protease [Halopseudomonas salegens]SDU38521.1 Trypsin [Halopseudomonas salegens]
MTMRQQSNNYLRYAFITLALLCSLAVPATLNAAPIEWVAPLHTSFNEASTADGVEDDVQRVISKRKAVPAKVVLPPFVQNKQQPAPTAADPLAAPLQVGTGRSVQQTETIGDLAARLEWEALDDGSLASAIEFTSPGAVGNRLILHIEHLDPRIQFHFSGGNPDEAATISAMSMLDRIFLNHAETPESDQARRFAAPYQTGDSTLLEIILPAGVDPDDLQLSVPHMSHLDVSPMATNPWLKAIGDSGSCNFDSICRPEWETVSNGVARMLFSNPSTGSSFLCSGSLLNDTSNSSTPYFLTANHCLSTQNVASTLQTFWFYRSTTCNSDNLSNLSRTLTGGSTLLYTASSTDTTLLRLNNTPPAGVNFLGWTNALPGSGQELGSLHHPRGDLQKVSIANFSQYFTCGLTQCTSGPQSNTTHLGVTWSSGVVEPGSSGSGLFWPTNGQRFLIGQLTGGNSSCDAPDGSDFYGRFDLAYQDGMQQWLNASTPPPPPPPPQEPSEPSEPEPTDPALPPAEDLRTPVYRFYNNNSRAHFFTASAEERDNVIERFSSFIYEGVAFYAYPASRSGLSPVYRFFNEATGSHFYTISQAERDSVIERFPSYIYEGVAWHAQTGFGSGSQPLYRFYNTATRSHFYTMSAAERDSVIERFASYIYEGVAYYTWTTP